MVLAHAQLHVVLIQSSHIVLALFNFYSNSMVNLSASANGRWLKA